MKTDFGATTPRQREAWAQERELSDRAAERLAARARATPLARFRTLVADYHAETGLRCQLAILGPEAYAELMADVSIKPAIHTSLTSKHVWIDGVMVKSA